MEFARFGPAGTSESFAQMGYKKTVQVPEYLEKFGLNAFEYQCGRGVRVNEKTMEELGRLARERISSSPCTLPTISPCPASNRSPGTTVFSTFSRVRRRPG